MFKYFALLLVALPAILGQEDVEITPYARGGRLALVGEFASECSLDTPLALHCQAVLMNDRHLLTAASCVVNKNTSAVINPVLLRVTCGNNHLFTITAGREVRSVSHIFPHDHFNPHTNANDLAVLRLATPLPLPHNTIEDAWIQERITPEETTCEFAGWATASNTSTLVIPEKRVINVPVVSQPVCNTLNNAGRVQESNICAGNRGPGVGNPPLVADSVCIGNVGGGLYCNGRLTGILSFGISCGQAEQPGVYVQPRFYHTWINQQYVRTDAIPVGTVFPRV